MFSVELHSFIESRRVAFKFSFMYLRCIELSIFVHSSKYIFILQNAVGAYTTVYRFDSKTLAVMYQVSPPSVDELKAIKKSTTVRAPL